MVDKNLRRETEKELYKNQMIDAAERVFYQNGFENSSMNEIAKESNFTKRTLYKYFASKDDLLFAVLNKGFLQFLTFMKAEISRAERGFDQFHAAIFAYYQFYKNYPETLQLLRYISQSQAEASDSAQRFVDLKKDIMLEVIRTIETGQRDGSIRADLDARQTTYSITFVLMGFLNELSVSGTTFSEHFALNENDFVMNTFDLLFKAFL
jgi:AcrR family transcriptional regulator